MVVELMVGMVVVVVVVKVVVVIKVVDFIMIIQTLQSSYSLFRNHEICEKPTDTQNIKTVFC